MNSLICFLTVFHLFKFVKRRWFISKSTRRLVYLGIFLPLGDYVIRIIEGDLWFFSGNLIFHSIPYHFIFWSVIALLFWVYSRDLLISLKFWFPISGVLVYMVFSIFGTEHLTFWSPISTYSFHLNWINAGYLIPTTVAALLWISKRWSEFSSIVIGRISISVLVIFLTLAAVVRHNAGSAIPEEIRNLGVVSIYPANNLQTEWQTVVYHNGEYQSNRYHFVQGYQVKFEKVDAFSDYDTAQSILMDSTIRNLYQFGFKNPVMNIEIQKEALRVDIKELNASSEPLWIKDARIVRNRSGLIVGFDVDYGTFF